MDPELERQCTNLMTSIFDAASGKSLWQCIQCNYSSKLRYTVKEHVETHISGFSHQCSVCNKTCKPRNALRVHTIRNHSSKGQTVSQAQPAAAAGSFLNSPSPVKRKMKKLSGSSLSAVPLGLTAKPESLAVATAGLPLPLNLDTSVTPSNKTARFPDVEVSPFHFSNILLLHSIPRSRFSAYLICCST